MSIISHFLECFIHVYKEVKIMEFDKKREVPIPDYCTFSTSKLFY